MNWFSQHSAWLFDGVGGLVSVTVIGWLLKRFVSRERDSTKEALTASATRGSASVTGSPVASGKNISQNITNVTIPRDAKHGDEAAQIAALDLLKDERWGKRSFRFLKGRLGGYQDDELRRILLSVGAVRFLGEDDEEFWGLRERNPESRAGSESKIVEIPSLRFVRAQRARLVPHAGAWQEFGDVGAPAIVAIFKNEPGKLGQRAPILQDVTSHLTYRNPRKQDEPELLIDFGTWVGKATHYATFNPAQTQSVIVALQIEDKFVALDNPKQTDPLAGRWRSGTIVYSPDKKEIEWLTGEVEIALVDGGGRTVFQNCFAYGLTVEGPMSLTLLDSR